jgi:hypothetical protein
MVYILCRQTDEGFTAGRKFNLNRPFLFTIARPLELNFCTSSRRRFDGMEIKFQDN